MDAGTAASLLGAGLLAGAVNTLAGGGSLVLVPALIAAGMPSTIASATSRIPILAQCAAGAAGFARGGKLPTAAVRNVLPPVMLGAGAGAYVATMIPARVLTPMILGTLVLMALAMVVVSPRRWAPPPDAVPRAARGPWAMLGLFAAGVYGGVLQAGAGLLFIGILAGGLRYDLVRANALKAVVMLAYIALTAAVFIAYDMVRWGPGLVMSVGAMIGAWLASQVALTRHGVLITRIVVGVSLVGSAAIMITRL